MAKKKIATTAYKGFDTNWQCREFKYEVGKSYEHEGKVKACQSGFHACEYPINIFNYYPPSYSKFALVELSGYTDHKDDGTTDVAAAKIAIKAELQIPELVEAAVEYVFDKAEWLNKSTANENNQAASSTGGMGVATATGDWGVASTTGYQGAASTTGYHGVATATGDWGVATATGDWGVASAKGHRGIASTTGSRGVASTTGYQGSASSTGDSCVASTTGTKGIASTTGVFGVACATGYQGVACATGVFGVASADGTMGIATASGYKGRAKGVDGNAIFLCERNNKYGITAVWAGIVGKDGIKPDTFYMLRDGKPVEANQ